MAISTQLQAQDLTPAYNRIEYWLESTNKNKDGHRYVFDVYEAGTSNKIAEYRIAPRFSDGYGVVDLSRLLRNYVTADYNTNTNNYDADASYYKYDLKVGEEYKVDYAYTGFTFSGDYVELTGFSSHTFTAGSQINLTESVVGTNPLLTGLHNVISVTASTVVIDVIYADMDSPSSIAGTLVYADGRKTLTRDIVTFSNKVVFNGALPWVEFRSYDDLIFTTTTEQLMTNLPNNFKITESQDLIINYYQNTASARYAVFRTSDGDELYKNISNASILINAVPCGINNAGTLIVNSGSLPLIKSTTEYYDFVITDGTFTDVTETKRIYVDRRCEIEPYHILFLDRLGSWGSFAFNLKANVNGTIKRDSFRKHIDGTVKATLFDYNTYAEGLTNYGIEVEEELTLRTNWMTYEDNEYFKELLTSYHTFIHINGAYQSCVVQDTSYETTQQRGKKLINKTVKVKLSNNDIING